jgi:hypothetical protein
MYFFKPLIKIVARNNSNQRRRIPNESSIKNERTNAPTTAAKAPLLGIEKTSGTLHHKNVNSMLEAEPLGTRRNELSEADFECISLSSNFQVTVTKSKAGKFLSLLAQINSCVSAGAEDLITFSIKDNYEPKFAKTLAALTQTTASPQQQQQSKGMQVALIEY